MRRVIREKFPKVANRVAVGRFLRRFREASLLVKPKRVHLSPDPDDNLILGTALAAQANYLVTGDKDHLLSLKKVNGTRVVKYPPPRFSTPHPPGP